MLFYYTIQGVINKNQITIWETKHSIIAQILSAPFIWEIEHSILTWFLRWIVQQTLQCHTWKKKLKRVHTSLYETNCVPFDGVFSWNMSKGKHMWLKHIDCRSNVLQHSWIWEMLLSIVLLQIKMTRTIEHSNSFYFFWINTDYQTRNTMTFHGNPIPFL